MDQVALTYYLVKNYMTIKEIGAGWGRYSSPTLLSNSAREVTQTSRFWSPAAGSATASSGARISQIGGGDVNSWIWVKKTYYLTRNCMKTKEFLPEGC